jgi:hypothetical protein
MRDILVVARLREVEGRGGRVVVVVVVLHFGMGASNDAQRRTASPKTSRRGHRREMERL